MQVINFNVSEYFCEMFAIVMKHTHQDCKATAVVICDELYEMSFKDDLAPRQVVLADLLYNLYNRSLVFYGTPLVKELAPK